jgi:hypothetical protein
MSVRVLWVEIKCFAICTNEGLSCEVDDMGKTAVVHLLSIKVLESSRNLLDAALAPRKHCLRPSFNMDGKLF